MLPLPSRFSGVGHDARWEDGHGGENRGQLRFSRGADRVRARRRPRFAPDRRPEMQNRVKILVVPVADGIRLRLQHQQAPLEDTPGLQGWGSSGQVRPGRRQADQAHRLAQPVASSINFFSRRIRGQVTMLSRPSVDARGRSGGAPRACA